MKSHKFTLKNTTLMVASFVVNAFGVALVTKAGLGTVPATSIPHVLGLAFPPSIGMFTFALSLVQILVQFFLLRKSFGLLHILQIVPSVVLSFFIDFFLWLLAPVALPAYWAQFLMMAVGCVVIAFSIAIEVFVDLVYLPLDGMVAAISQKTRRSFDLVKTITDCAMVAVAVGLAFLFMGRLEGIREGTVFSAVFAGLFVRLFSRTLFKKRSNV